MRSCGIFAGIAAALLLSACGGGTEQDASEPSGIFPVRVALATFPTFQRLAQHTHMVILVRNTGLKTIPDIAVTITDPPYGTAVQAFGRYVSQPGLASHSRPVWIIDRPPGPCTYSCLNGGPGGAVTAYSNTWALGRLAPGQTATFIWGVTAVAPGTHIVRYEVAAGLNGKAKARLSTGAIPTGTFRVRITQQPQQSYVNNNGQIVAAK
jgi:hypothetical protein